MGRASRLGGFSNRGVNLLEGPKFVLLEGPKFVVAGLSLMTDFPLTERMKLQFRTSMTNVANHPNVGLPGADIELPVTLGKFTSTYSPLFGQNARQVDFTLSLVF